MGQNFPNVYILWEGCEKPVKSYQPQRRHSAKKRLSEDSLFFNIGYDYSDRLLSISTNLSASSSPVPRAKLVTQAS